MKIQKHHEGCKFKDMRTGDIWIKRYKGDAPYVWNEKQGQGIWDDGKHLQLLTPLTS